MSLSTVYSRAINDTRARAVSVEVHLARGLPSFSIVGLPEAAVRESRDRVRAAILNSGFEFPRKRITVNLAPADLPKEGAGFDLAIAIGVLTASDQISKTAVENTVFLGELALSGQCRKIRGALIAAISTKHSGERLILPVASYYEAALVDGAHIESVTSLTELSAILNGLQKFIPAPTVELPVKDLAADFSDVSGQPMAKLALEIAAAGFHNVLMQGPPGSGKTMLASRLPGIMPQMTLDEAMESAAIASLSRDGFQLGNWRQRPFRNPHHSASGAALAGGGSYPRPGEISLAHNGVLFLDELPEFERRVLELLREPLEAGKIHISRAAQQSVFLARFLMVAACNPCPCGFLGQGDKCICSVEQLNRYKSKLSGPLLDRIDMVINVPLIPLNELRKGFKEAESSDQIRQRVERATQIQLHRQGCQNSQIPPEQIELICQLDSPAEMLIEHVIAKYDLSARGYHRLLRVSRTIADLQQCKSVSKKHLLISLQLRQSG